MLHFPCNFSDSIVHFCSDILTMGTVKLQDVYGLNVLPTFYVSKTLCVTLKCLYHVATDVANVGL